MAVARDATGTITNQTDNTAGAHTLSPNYTGLTVVSNTNGAILFFAHICDTTASPATGAALASVTGYTLIGAISSATASSSWVRTEIWGKVANSTGAQTIVVASNASWSVNTQIQTWAVSWTGVNQTGGATSFAHLVTAQGTTNNPSSGAITKNASADATVSALSDSVDVIAGPNKTQLYLNNGNSPSSTAQFETGGASTQTHTWTYTVSSAQWAIVALDLVASTASGTAGKQFTDLPPSRFAYSEWQKWTEQALTTIPVPTILTQTLRVQRDFPNPIDYQRLPDYSWLEPGNSIVPQPRILTQTLRTQVTAPNPNPVTWYQSWEKSTRLPRPTPFIPVDQPNPYPVYWYRSLEVSGLSLRTITQNPFNQDDWPNPQRIIWYQSWTESFNLTNPFSQLDWPVSKTYNPIDQFWSQSLNLFYQSETFPFVQSDYPNPQRVIWYQDWFQSLLQSTLKPAFQAPFNQFDWPLSRTYAPIDQFWQNNLQLLPRPTPFFQNVDFPLPVVSQPIDPTWIGNLSEFIQSSIFPFVQSDYPNPYPIYWYQDYNQNLVIYLPVGIKPFNQSDWPLSGTTSPIDQYWYQALVLNLPVPPPPVQQDLGGKTWTREEWTQKLTEYVRKAQPLILTEMSTKGGHARAASLTPQQRSSIALKAASIRWQSK